MNESPLWIDYNITTGPEFGRLNQVPGGTFGGFTFYWPKEPLSAAILGVAFSMLIITCCGSLLLVIAACCGSRRRDTVAESTQSRWLPGVGIIDYVPPSERSSVRVSLMLDNEEGEEGNQEPVSLPLKSSDSAYRPFRETLDTPSLEEGQTKAFPRNGMSKEESMTFSETEMMLYNEGNFEVESEDSSSLVFKKCSDNKDFVRMNIKSDKKARQLRKEIEMIELKIKKVNSPSKVVSKHVSVDDLLVETKHKEDFFRLLWNKQTNNKNNDNNNNFGSWQTIS